MSDNFRRVLSAKSLIGDTVENQEGEKLGKLEEIMIDLESGRVAYAVLSFGGFLGMGEKLFALPWNKIYVDQDKQRVIFNAKKAQLESMPGFNKEDWPDMTDPQWQSQISSYYDKW